MPASRWPRSTAIARVLPRNGYALNIEIKPTPGSEAETGRVVAEEAARLWRGAALPPLLSSFRRPRSRRRGPRRRHLPRALLLDGLRSGWLDEAKALGCVAVVMAHALMDAAVLASLHAAGLRGLCYTVNDPAEAARLSALGIDGSSPTRSTASRPSRATPVDGQAARFAPLDADRSRRRRRLRRRYASPCSCCSEC